MSKIKAGAIQYVLVVSVIIMIVLFAFISLIFLQNRVRLKSEVYKETIQSTYLAMDYLAQKEIPYETEATFQFTDHEQEDTRIVKKRWGLFDIGIVKSKINNETFEKTAILGNHAGQRKAVYLKENNQPLVVVGNTQIVGDVSLPKRGVKTGNIAGVSYYGNELVYGDVKTSSSRLPEIKNLDYIKRIPEGIPIENYKNFSLEEGIEIKQSFDQETLLFETANALILANMSLQGNIVLVSTSMIRVLPTARLENIILIAPEVVIDSGFQGSCQVFSTHKILVNDQVKLNYPSGLTLFDEGENENEKQEKLVIKKGADVRGIVLYQNDNEKSNYDVQVLIEEGSRITGEIFCSQNLELRGTVNGFVYTNNFITRQSGGVYINHLFNVKIDAETIPEEYTGLFIGETNRTVAQWIQ